MSRGRVLSSGLIHDIAQGSPFGAADCCHCSLLLIRALFRDLFRAPLRHPCTIALFHSLFGGSFQWLCPCSCPCSCSVHLSVLPLVPCSVPSSVPIRGLFLVMINPVRIKTHRKVMAAAQCAWHRQTHTCRGLTVSVCRCLVCLVLPCFEESHQIGSTIILSCHENETRAHEKGV